MRNLARGGRCKLPAIMAPRISLIIPAYNEEKFLPRLLDTVDKARAVYPGEVEVIVADNMSTDSTAAIAASRGCRVVPVEKRVIGAVRNGGAAAAQGEILCFVDADFRIHPQTFNAVQKAIDGGRIVAGSTSALPERWSAGIVVCFAFLMPIILATKVDIGVVYCRKEDFEAIGGYQESRLFAEDVAFLLTLRSLGKKRKQRLARLTSAKAVASTRKFDEFGDWHYFTLTWHALPSLFSGKQRSEFTERYWYKPKR